MIKNWKNKILSETNIVFSSRNVINTISPKKKETKIEKWNLFFNGVNAI